MIKPFKFFRGYTYSDEFTLLSIPRRMSGRTISQDLVPVQPMGPPSYMLNRYNTADIASLADLSNEVNNLVRSPEYIPAGYVSIPIQFNYDSFVISRVRTKMRRNINWRGYETSIQEREGAVIILKIVSGINIGGMFHIVYLITRDGNTENYRVSVPLVNLQRRG